VHLHLTQLIATYGYLIIFLFVTADGIGVPLPGETALLTAAALSASGRLSLPLVIAAAWAGCIVGGSGGYWVGRAGERFLEHRHVSRVGLTPPRVAKARAFFDRHGAKTILFARFVALLRVLASILAGMSGMSFGMFSLYNAAGGLLWAATFGGIGYGAGRALPRLAQSVGRAGFALAALVLLVTVLVIGLRWLRDHHEYAALRLHGWRRRALATPAMRRLRERNPGAGRMLRARLSPLGYLGLHLTLGLTLSAAALLLFGSITEDSLPLEGTPLTRFDLSLAAKLAATATPALDRFLVAVSLVGSPAVMAALGIVIAVVLLVRRRWILLVTWLAALAGGGLLDALLKAVIRRPHPAGSFAYLHGETYSFPSSHAMGSLIAFGLLAYLVCRFTRDRRWDPVITALAASLILLIGFSRLYLGVHYFSDLIVGYAAGAVWLAACLTGAAVAREQRGRRQRVRQSGERALSAER
jgi:membrane protein DedA with SNARE-associated domain/membrane-associated phospholipid phosphatase